jgi:hypothetical protein
MAQGKGKKAKLLQNLVSPLQSIHETRPHFVAFPLYFKGADLGNEHSCA